MGIPMSWPFIRPAAGAKALQTPHKLLSGVRGGMYLLLWGWQAWPRMVWVPARGWQEAGARRVKGYDISVRHQALPLPVRELGHRASVGP
jgi:hypothetical protein